MSPEELRQGQRQLGVTQAQFAERGGVSTSLVTSSEVGRRTRTERSRQEITQIFVEQRRPACCGKFGTACVAADVGWRRLEHRPKPAHRLRSPIGRRLLSPAPSSKSRWMFPVRIFKKPAEEQRATAKRDQPPIGCV